MKKIISTAKPFLFQALGLFLLYLALTDRHNTWQMIGEVMIGLLALFIGIGLQGEHKSEQQGHAVHDERDELINQKTSHVTLAVVNGALLAITVGAALWYTFGGHSLVAGSIALGALILWCLINLITIVTGFAVSRLN